MWLCNAKNEMTSIPLVSRPRTPSARVLVPRGTVNRSPIFAAERRDDYSTDNEICCCYYIAIYYSPHFR